MVTNAAYQVTKKLCNATTDIDKDAQGHEDVYQSIIKDLNIVFGPSLIEPDFDDFHKDGGVIFAWLSLITFKLKRKRNENVLLKQE